jgi:hypothetical protein
VLHGGKFDLGHEIDNQIDHSVILRFESNMKGHLTVVIFEMEWFQENWVEIFIVLQDELEFFILRSDEISFCEHVIAVENEIVPFNIENKVIDDKTKMIKVILNDEGHVGEGEIDEVTENDPVLGLVLDSDTIIERKGRVFSIKIRNLELVTLGLVSVPAVDQVVLLYEVWFA